MVLSLRRGANLEALRRAVRDEGLWQSAAERWYALYRPYIPVRTGYLAGAATIRPGEIVHTAPYARRVYEGAGGHWDRHADAWLLAAHVAREIGRRL